MERFAFKIDNALKANLYKICRLCGIDHPFMISITDYEKNRSASCNDPTLCYKILNLVGLTVHKRDNMPQSACNTCVDKINDFFEFRETCVATDAQTRKLLGIKVDNPSLPVDKARGRKRKTDEVIDITEEDDKYGIKKKIKIEDTKFVCNICKERFPNDQKLQGHLVLKHIPNVPRYACYACDHIIYLPSEVKDHEMWHKVSKTAYVCGFCEQKLTNKHAYTRHLRQHALSLGIKKLPVLKDCPQCQKAFQTCYLYNIHACAMRTQTCGGCNKVYRGIQDLVKHIPKCVKAYKKQHATIPAGPIGNNAVLIKNENIVEPPVGVPAEAMAVISVKQEFQNNLDRVDNLLRQTINAFHGIKKEPALDENIAGNHSEYQFEDDHHDDEDYANNDVSENITEPIVKLEVGENIKDNIAPPLPRLKIKLEHGTLNSSILNGEDQTTTDSLNMNISNNTSIHIKHEPLERDIENTLASSSSSSIQISSVSSGVSFEAEKQHEISDVKPNRLELDRLMNIEAMAATRIIKTEPIESNVRIKLEPMCETEVIPKISSVSSGASVLKMREGFRIKTEIKSEPCDYDDNNQWQNNADEIVNSNNIKQEPSTLNITSDNCDIAQQFIKQEPQELIRIENDSDVVILSDSESENKIDATPDESNINNNRETESQLDNVENNSNSLGIIDEQTKDTTSNENTETNTVNQLQKTSPNENTDTNTVNQLQATALNENTEVVNQLQETASNENTDIDNQLKETSSNKNDELKENSTSNISINNSSENECPLYVIANNENTYETTEENQLNENSTITSNSSTPTTSLKLTENNEVDNPTQLMDANTSPNVVETCSSMEKESTDDSNSQCVEEDPDIIEIFNESTTNQITTIELEDDDEDDDILEVTSFTASTRDSPEKSDAFDSLKVINFNNILTSTTTEIPMDNEKVSQNLELSEPIQIEEEEENVISVELSLEKEHTNESPPTQETIGQQMEECHSEEQQNELNQHVANQNEIINTTMEENEENNKSNVDEITENILNESVEEHESPSIMNRVVNDNINEIAENNNNANIERELQEVNASSLVLEPTPSSTTS